MLDVLKRKTAAANSQRVIFPDVESTSLGCMVANARGWIDVQNSFDGNRVVCVDPVSHLVFSGSRFR